uniref:Ovule protein n=1 Tax=Strongyloides venezuelensis TaxID=75913 RepID=A0A0K0EWF3_STRVS
MHIGWYVAPSLNWCSVIILNINSISIYCYEVIHKYEYKTLVVPQKNSISLGSTISLSKTHEAAKENSTKARSKSNLDKRSTGNRKLKSRAVVLPKSGNMSFFVNTPKRK